ncbi:hypothetical protein BN946_scf184589.g2 [Trametes cinnabarina]|uniref:DNA 3'-5' helicase n=1 Tax=Pycnoporus cinnabarinus TaxID=5643 RepID=A0A060SZ91_PYCCI|nr:hypothetical protein BN946_scf184589.g2 [Trametes cinnabarina]
MLRALRIIDGHVALMRTYHKMRAAQGLDRVIPHSLNASLAATFIYKEALCRPFAELCANVLYPDNPKVKAYYQNYLFVNYDRPFIGDDISEEMKRWTKIHLGIELGIQKWRQCSTPLRRQHAGLEEMWLEDQDTVDSAQAGHSHRVDWMRYGVTERAALGLAEDYIGPFFRTSVLWHNVLHLVPGGKLLSLQASMRKNYTSPPATPLSNSRTVLPAINVDAVAEAVITRLEPRLAALEQRVQATATSHEVASMFGALKTLLQDSLQSGHTQPAPTIQTSLVYQPPLLKIQENRATASLQNTARACSPMDRTEGMYVDNQKSAPPTHASQIPSGSVFLPSETVALAALRQVLQQPEAMWSNEGQKLAVMSGLEWQKDIVVILPTGSGKSAVVATVTKLESLKVTAVLCPLKSLLADWQRRLKQLSFPFEVFSPSSPIITGQNPIVLVSLDATDRATWHQAVAGLRPEVQLNRYVVDEAHLILTEASYREVMSHVKELRTHRAQLMLLSATVAPKSIPALRVAFNLAPGDHTRIIRASSNRPEFAFHMPKRMETIDKAAQLVASEILPRIMQLSAEERTLVFVQQLEHGHLMAQALQCNFYRGSTDTQLKDKQREAMVDSWHTGQYKTMVATDAFGPGNDYPHVRIVAFVGFPKGVVDMLQAAGRGGRDGRKVDILFFSLPSNSLPGTINDSHLGRDELAPVLKQPQHRCWRAVFTQFLDGIPHSCADSLFNWKCPKCRGGSKLVRPAGWIRKEDKKTFHITPTLPSASLILHSDVLSPQLGTTRARAPSTIAPLPSSIGAVVGSGHAFAAQAQVAKRLRSDRDAELQPLVDRVRAATSDLSGHCAFCHVWTGHDIVPQHGGGGIIRCPSLQELMKKTEDQQWKTFEYYLDWKKTVKYQKGVQICWKCHIPFLHDRLHAAKEGGVDGCNPSHDDMVMPVAYWAYLTEGVRKDLMREFKQDWSSDLVYAGWLGQKEKGQDFANVIRVFLWVVEVKLGQSQI